MLIFGLSLLFYPDVASWWNSRIQRGIALIYDEEVARLSQEHIANQFRRAEEVNNELARSTTQLLLAHLAPLPEDYFEILYVGGVMGRIEIPIIGVNMPIYHSTGHNALDRGVGHMEGTAFPIGGESTHSVLTAHTGLANARMFNDLEGNVHIGDKFFITVMGVRKAYEVDHVIRILPWETEHFRIVPGEDFVTLMTCTPYGINSHRWLVRGRRTEYIPYMAAEIVQNIIEPRVDIRIYIFVGLFLLFMVVFAVYSALKGKKEATNARRPRTVHPTPVAAIVTHDRYNGLTIDDMFNDLESQTSPPSYEVHTQPARVNDNKIAQTIKPLKPALIGKNARSKRKGFSPIPSMSRYIATGFISLMLIIIIGIGVSQNFSRPGSSSQVAIYNFVTMIDDYKTEYRDRWVAEQIGRWMESGELAAPGEGTFESPLSWLYDRMAEYNHRLYESGMGNLPDPFDANQPNVNLNHFGFEYSEMIGFVTIPSIDAELPLYMGANNGNLSRGLAHVTGTSLPLGGANTNTIIAGREGQRRTSLLENINNVSVGDEIHITNFHKTVIYTVVNIYQGSTINTDALTIQPGQDILTLLGYNQSSSQRYTIVATRANHY